MRDNKRRNCRLSFQVWQLLCCSENFNWQMKTKNLLYGSVMLMERLLYHLTVGTTVAATT
jgi:hypothetical protein